MAKNDTFIDTLSDMKMLFHRVLLFLMIFVFLLGFVFKVSLWWISAMIAVFAFVVFYLTRDSSDLIRGLKQLRLFFFTEALALMEIMNGFFFSLTMQGFAKGALMITMIILDIVILIMTCVMMYSKKKENADTRERMIIKVDKDTENGILHPGDAQIGVDAETRIPCVLPLHDRYLHMLILGPTGSGKTSQILLPMIVRDIQESDLGVICLEPKGDLADQVYAVAKLAGKKDPILFDPTLNDCPYFNPLMGDIDDVTENLVTAFGALENETQTFFANMNEMLLRRSIRVVKFLKGDDATLKDVDIVMTNPGNKGRQMVQDFLKLKNISDIHVLQDNDSVGQWFLSDYYTGLAGGRDATKTYEQCSGVRNQVAKLQANSYLNRVLNPPKSSELKEDEYIDFDKILAQGRVVALNSADGKLQELSKFLGFFIILSLQSAVFRRPGTEKTRNGVMLYIDEFQTYANKGFSNMLTKGRSYRVASHLATQNRALIGQNNNAHEGNAFLNTVSTNCRNVVIFPGANTDDAAYYSKDFGEEFEEKEKVSVSKKGGLAGLFDHSFSESHSVQEQWNARFRPTDIVYREFGEALVRLVVHNTVQKPKVVRLQWIPKKLLNQIENFIEEYKSNREFAVMPRSVGGYEEYRTVSSGVDDDADFYFDETVDNEENSYVLATNNNEEKPKVYDFRGGEEKTVDLFDTETDYEVDDIL